MTVHNEAKFGEIAKTVLMPGDPLRARMIAEKYLEDYKLVNSVRGMFAYTGFYKGKKITVMASGMGIPSMGIYSYELYKFYDVDNIIRIGTCGSLIKNLSLYDIVVARDSYSISTYGTCYGDTCDIINGDDYIIAKIKEEATKLNKKIIEVRSNTSDTFYADSNIDDLVNNKGCSIIEMETFGLYFNAKLLNKKAAAIFTISDNIITKEETTPEERQNKFTDMIEIALNTAINL